MKIIRCNLENFASYKTLDFSFDSQGLALIHGATGSGKSTLCDAIPWILFGKTAKNGSVDEVLSWPGDEVTKGTLQIDLSCRHVTIVRTRGTKANDLWYEQGDMPNHRIVRGKDLNDTQKLINNLLGLDADLYLSGAYFHEFSQAAQFFTTTAKNRRSICEQLVDLSLPKKLQEQVKLAAKTTKDQLQSTQAELKTIKSNQDLLQGMLNKEIERALAWEEKQVAKKSDLLSKATNFRDDKLKKQDRLLARIQALDVSSESQFDCAIKEYTKDLPPELEPCKECGTSKKNEIREEILEAIQDLKDRKAANYYKLRELDSLQLQLNQVEEEQNTYQEQLDTLVKDRCPAYEAADDIMQKIATLGHKFVELTKQESTLVTKQTDLDILSDITTEFRSNLIKNTVLDIETQTNLLLEKHFEGEIKIELLVDESDKLEVVIMKDANLASYTQLSKGQRQMLKLTFAISVMKAVSNHHGVNFSQIMLDEGTDGMDDNNKMKAVNMLEHLALEYDSIFLIEHSETVKAMIPTKYHVRLVNGQSEIQEET